VGEPKFSWEIALELLVKAKIPKISSKKQLTDRI